MKRNDFLKIIGIENLSI